MLLFCNSTIIKVHGMHNIAYILMTEDQSLVKANESHTRGKLFFYSEKKMWLQVLGSKEESYGAGCYIWEWTEKVTGRRQNKPNSDSMVTQIGSWHKLLSK